jgi:hypothetical protein
MRPHGNATNNVHDGHDLSDLEWLCDVRLVPGGHCGIEIRDRCVGATAGARECIADPCDHSAATVVAPPNRNGIEGKRVISAAGI